MKPEKVPSTGVRRGKKTENESQNNPCRVSSVTRFVVPSLRHRLRVMVHRRMCCKLQDVKQVVELLLVADVFYFLSQVHMKGRSLKTNLEDLSR